MNSEQDAGATGHDRDELAEEFRRLLDAAAARAEEHLRGISERNGPEDAAAPNCSASCGWCPVCAFATVLRGERPGSTTRLLDQLNAFVRLLRQVLAEHGEQRADAEDPATGRADADRPPEAGDKVQRIEVRRVRGRTGRPSTAAAGSAAAGDALDGRSEGGKSSC